VKEVSSALRNDTRPSAFEAGLRRSPSARLSAAYYATWVGLLLPVVLVEARDRIALQHDALSPISLTRAAVPMIALGASMLFWPVQRRRSLTYAPLIAAFVALAALSALWSGSSALTIGKAAQLGVAYSLVWRLASLAETRGQPVERHVIIVSAAICALALGTAVANPSQGFLHDPFGASRLTGAFPRVHPNTLGFAAGVVLVGSVSMSRRGVFGPSRSRLLLLTLGLLVLYLAQARTPLVLAVLGTLAVIALERRGRTVWGLVAAAYAGAATMALAGKSEGILAYGLRGQEATDVLRLTGRTAGWELALEWWSTSPWLGLGYYSGHRVGGFADAFVRRRHLETANLDNMWIEVGLNLGVVGVALLCLLVFLPFLRRVGEARCSPREYSLRLVGAAFAIGVSMFNPVFQLPGLQMVVGALFLFPSAPTDVRGATDASS
jgi:O-antigen ligase